MGPGQTEDHWCVWEASWRLGQQWKSIVLFAAAIATLLGFEGGISTARAIRRDAGSVSSLSVASLTLYVFSLAVVTWCWQVQAHRFISELPQGETRPNWRSWRRMRSGLGAAMRTACAATPGTIAVFGHVTVPRRLLGVRNERHNLHRATRCIESRCSQARQGLSSSGQSGSRNPRSRCSSRPPCSA